MHIYDGHSVLTRTQLIQYKFINSLFLIIKKNKTAECIQFFDVGGYRYKIQIKPLILLKRKLSYIKQEGGFYVNYVYLKIIEGVFIPCKGGCGRR